MDHPWEAERSRHHLRIGALLTGVFAAEASGGAKGLIEGNLDQVLTQAYGVGVSVTFSAAATLLILKALDATLGLRVDTETERDGLDLALHGETVH